MPACPRCGIERSCFAGHCKDTDRQQYFSCARRPGWDPDHFATTPVAELPTRDTFEILGAEYYFEPETDTIMLLDSSVNEAGTPFEDYAPPGDESPPDAQAPAEPVTQRLERSMLPFCPMCRLTGRRTAAGTYMIGECRQSGQRRTCLRQI